MPERMQRQRTKGWTMPPNTIYVGRPSVYGNPFVHSDPAYAVKAYRLYLANSIDFVSPFVFSGPRLAEYKENLPMEVQVLGLDEPLTMMQCPNVIRLHDALPRLVGKNVSCWCPLDQPCHGDVLLRLANS